MDLFFSFNGRINRAKWWVGILALFVVQMLLWALLGTVFGLSAMGSFDPNDAVSIDAMMEQMSEMIIPAMILFAIMIYPTLAVHTKRWHDRNKS